MPANVLGGTVGLIVFFGPFCTIMAGEDRMIHELGEEYILWCLPIDLGCGFSVEIHGIGFGDDVQLLQEGRCVNGIATLFFVCLAGTVLAHPYVFPMTIPPQENKREILFGSSYKTIGLRAEIVHAHGA